MRGTAAFCLLPSALGNVYTVRRMNTRHLLAVALLTIFTVACRDKTPAAHVRMMEKNVKLPFGRCTPVTLEWDMRRPLDRASGKPVVFLHLLLPPHDVVRTFDHPFPAEWRAGSKHTYKHDLCQSIDAPRINPGSYIISAGLYDGGDGERWPLTTDGREVGKMEYAIGDAEALDEGDVVRAIEFDGGWGPLESAGDRQVVARRLFHKGGPSASIRMKSKVSDTVRVVLGVSDGNATVTNSCAPGDTRTVTPGFHTLDLSACDGGEIRVDRGGAKVSLDGVAWK
jgi:hypothetical protein